MDLGEVYARALVDAQERDAQRVRDGLPRKQDQPHVTPLARAGRVSVAASTIEGLMWTSMGREHVDDAAIFDLMHECAVLLLRVHEAELVDVAAGEDPAK